MCAAVYWLVVNMSFFNKYIKTHLQLIGKNSLCNKYKDRTPHIGSLYFILCWRCTGVVVGAVILGYILKIYQFEISIFFRILFFVPLILDGAFSYYSNFYCSNNAKRFLTGLLAGVAIV